MRSIPTLALILTLTFPNPAFALRVASPLENAGLEELSRALDDAPDIHSPRPATGMEEDAGKDDLYISLALEEAWRGLDDSAKLEIAFENMADDNPGVRESAAVLLATIQDPQAFSLLARMLQDTHWRVRQVAARGLERLGWQPSTAQEKILFHVIRRHWKDLVGFEPELIFAELSGPLETAPEPVQILRSAGLLRDARALPLLLGALQGDDPALRQDAAAALDEIGWQPVTAIEMACLRVAKRDREGALPSDLTVSRC